MNYLEIIGTIVGFVYLILEYRASFYLWIAGIIMPAIYIFVYYDAGLYADVAINIYYLLIAVYGYILWTKGYLKRRSRKKSANREIADDEKSATVEELKITRTPIKCYYIYSAIFILTFILIGLVLVKFTDSNVPWLDSFTTALSIVGMIMLARKYLEQWIVWIAVDVVYCGLYIYKDLIFTSILYGVYAIIAIFGYYKWEKMMKDEIE